MPATLDPVFFLWNGSFPDFERAYAEVAAAGAKAVVMNADRAQLNLRQEADAATAGRILARLGLTAPACHGLDAPGQNLNEATPENLPRLLDDHLGLLRHVAPLGCRTYVLHLGFTDPAQDRPASWDRVRNAVDALAPEAEALGIALALENGMAGYQASNEELLSLVADYAHPAVGICYDSGHAHVSTGRATEVLESFAPYVVTVHLHDNDGTGDQHLLPGQGTIDWVPLAAALRQCPRLLNVETEAANCPQWPPARDYVSYAEAYALYRRVVGV